jgi:2-amino-4-hydroxy-6-hydroxymethyldihydropteridine diphosphokinase
LGEIKDIYLSLGTNLGDRVANLEQSIEELMRIGGKVHQRSSIYRTAAWGNDHLKEFLNMVVRIQHHLSPQELLQEIKGIESEMGRLPIKSKTGKRIYQDRIIDIDILYYGQKVIDSEKLVIPHPHLHLRHFVLEPLREIAPQYIHPLFKKSTLELFDSCPDPNKVELHS